MIMPGPNYLQRMMGEKEYDKEKRAQFAAEIFSKYGCEIRAMIQFSIKESADVDDIFQDFFLSLMANPIPSNVNNMRRYLFKAITHDIINMSRRVKRYQERVRTYAEIRRYRIVEDDPHSVVINAEETKRFFGRVQNVLRPSEAQALFWRYKEGSNTTETAKRMGIKPRSCARYLCTALKKLRSLDIGTEGGR